MEISGKKIAKFLENNLKKEIIKLGKKRKIKLVDILVGKSEEQLSYVATKAKVARRLGIKFEMINLKQAPSFESFMHIIKEKSLDPEVTGIIIQQPLPAQLSTDSLYDYIPDEKEIEGHKRKSPFTPPLGLAVLTILKYVFASSSINKELLVNISKEKTQYKKLFRNKKIVLIGRGLTGGNPIGKTLTEAKINFINVNSQTPDPENYYKEADIIISAVGKYVLSPEMLKTGVTLINAGLRREKNILKGDYNEKEIKNIASSYTPTPGGIGPIDIFYLYKNLVDAFKLQR